jgi:hypothetical protein
VELAGERVSAILFTGEIADLHVGLEVDESLKPASLAARKVLLAEEVLDGVMVGKKSEVLTAFEVMAEDAESMYNSKELKLMNRVVIFCRGELAAFETDRVL